MPDSAVAGELYRHESSLYPIYYSVAEAFKTWHSWDKKALPKGKRILRAIVSQKSVFIL